MKKFLNMISPKYPIYIPSKGRFDPCLTARAFIKDNVPFFLVVEPQEKEEYGSRYGYERLLILPWSGNDVVRQKYCSDLGIENGGLIAVRNWIKADSIKRGFERHWQLDDNIRGFRKLYQGKRVNCNANYALGITEDFVDRYTNVAIAGLNYEMFGIKNNYPYTLNAHVYSCSLINNKIPYKWRLAYNDDTDICLQALAGGWCTILMNIFLASKMRTMTIGGGNTTDLYQGDGRLVMAHALETRWPGVVETKRRFQRPQHVIKNAWRHFDTQLIRRTDIDWDKLKGSNEYGMKLVKKDNIKSKLVNKLYNDFNAK